MWILGVNAPPAGWHDAAACLVDGSGNVIAYSEQERHNRVRHAIGDGFNKPVGAARFCLDQAGITIDDIDVIAIGWNVDQMFPGFFADERELATHATGFDFPGRLPRIVRVPHHEAHAASAFYASPFSEAGVLVIDGNGENESTSIWSFSYGRAPELKRAWPRTASLGYAYDGASEWLGFHHLNAGKTMGLAAYGRAQGLSVETLLDIDGGDLRPAVPSLPESHGQATIDEIGRHYGATVAAWRDLYSKLAGADGPTVPVHRLPEDPAAVLVAYTAQRLIEDAVTSLASTARGLAGVEELCLAGGVALNCSANGVLPGPVFVPPVPHDAGVALGAAWTVCPPRRTGEAMSPYLGEDVRAPGVAHPEMSGLLRTDFDADQVTDLLLDGQVGAVAQGRAEIGPRALCHRSILAVPDTADVHARVNRIKHASGGARSPASPSRSTAPGCGSGRSTSAVTCSARPASPTRPGGSLPVSCTSTARPARRSWPPARLRRSRRYWRGSPAAERPPSSSTRPSTTRASPSSTAPRTPSRRSVPWTWTSSSLTRRSTGRRPAHDEHQAISGAGAPGAGCPVSAGARPARKGRRVAGSRRTAAR